MTLTTRNLALRTPRQFSTVIPLSNGKRAAIRPAFIGWRWSVNNGDGRGPIKTGWTFTRDGAVRAAKEAM